VEARLAFFGLVVDDIPRSLAFYRHVGLDIPADADQAPHVEYTLPGGLVLAWDSIDTVKSFDPDWVAPTGGHRIAIAFACPNPAAVDDAFASLLALGYREQKAPWDAFWGQRYAIVLDPDGNHVEFSAALPADS
jgi:catechol 2,3-dioxygenase-like lactoylglutathione lyase family enzyme